jgi:hypothetical protein
MFSMTNAPIRGSTTKATFLFLMTQLDANNVMTPAARY